MVSRVSHGGLIFAAPNSGSGKTLIVAGLLHCLRQRGLRVVAAKCGPDYIDPTFHALASGAACLNLDPWAMRPATLAGVVRSLEDAGEIVLCEGVMGMQLMQYMAVDVDEIAAIGALRDAMKVPNFVE